ncbi:MAG: hypothetical protein NTX75_05995 [Proteobacteria bacterium]|nr:hypothetical protein [Pseudomonadota bacterium]
MHRFYEILQSGFFVKCRTGISINALLSGGLGLNPRYVNERITTVFLDGSCVDNIERAVIKEGSTLALSSAMPGLAGATLRRDSVYATLRSSITYEEKDDVYRDDTEGIIRVKLFNLLIDELGPVFLQRGIMVKADEIIQFLKRQPETFRVGCSDIIFDGKAVNRSILLDGEEFARSDFIFLKIIIIT